MTPRGIIDCTEVRLTRPQEIMVRRLYSDGLLDTTSLDQITYYSDGLHVKGYIARPKAPGSYPVILWNRGGSGDRGALDNLTAHLILSSTAQWGYVLLGTEYRGNMGSEGTEDWGGKDADDALNLLDLADEIEGADTSRVAIEGASRGGMTTYRILARDHRFKCAVVHAGITDLFGMVEAREDFARFIDKQFGSLTPDERTHELSSRSAIYFADRFPKSCPILLLHGTADRVVPQSQSKSLAKELDRHQIPHELVMIEGGGHVALKDGSYREIDRHRRRWYDRYLKNSFG